MKVLFLYTNINGFHADGFGDGIAQIMSVTKKAGYDIANMQIFEKSEYSQLEDLIINYRPDVVGFTSVSSQFSYVLELTDIIKKISQKIITVCGGVHTTLYPQCVLENKNLDNPTFSSTLRQGQEICVLIAGSELLPVWWFEEKCL